MAVVENDVIAYLTADGRTIANYFLIGTLVCHRNVRGEPMAHAIDDPELAAATMSYLLGAGVQQYSSGPEYFESNPVVPTVARPNGAV